MKKLKIIISFFVILAFSNIAFAETGIVNTPAARMREKASKDSKILTKVYEDEKVEIIEEDDEWYKVNANGQTGYISKSLIKVVDKTDSSNNTVSNNTTDDNTIKTDNTTQNEVIDENKVEEPVENSTSKTIIKDDVVARVLPNFSSNEIVLLVKGTEIEVIRDVNKWTEILYSNQRLWIPKNKIEYTNNDIVPNEENPQVTENNTVSTNELTNTVTNEVTENNTASNNTVENNNTSNNTVDSNLTSETRKKGVINVETANIREKAEKNSKIIARLDEFDEVTILQEDGDFYKITCSELESGYVAKRLVTISDVSSRGNVEAREENEEKTSDISGADVVDFAKKYLGTKYVLGGKTPESGFDCSGYTRYVFKNFGFSLGTVACEQDSIGSEVDRENLVQGDLILFYNEENTKIGHTGIYIGNNEFIHAANPERGVVIDNLLSNSYYSTRFVTARRIVE